MKKLLLLSLTILLFSCGDSILWDDADPQPFRDKWKNTYWKWGDLIYTFDNNIIYKEGTLSNDYQCYIYKEGSFDDVVHSSGCSWANITNVILEETNNKFVFKTVATDNDNGDNCNYYESLQTIRIINNNKLIISDEWEDGTILDITWIRLEDGVTPPTYTDCESW